MALLELFQDIGGPWLTLLAAVAIVARITASGTDDDHKFIAGVSRPWFGWFAAVIAASAVVAHFMRLWNGSAFVTWTARRPWVHTFSGALALGAIALSVVGYYRFRRQRPWLSLALVLACIVVANAVLHDAPRKFLSHDDPGDDRDVVAFVQGRLATYGCFAAAGESERDDGELDATTQAAINSFQLANGLLARPTLDRPYAGQLRPSRELRLLTQPFPWLGTVRRCKAY